MLWRKPVAWTFIGPRYVGPLQLLGFSGWFYLMFCGTSNQLLIVSTRSQRSYSHLQRQILADYWQFPREYYHKYPQVPEKSADLFLI